MKRLMLLSTALIFSATMSMAALSAPDLVAAYQAKGYTKIEVTTGLTQIKVEAVQGTAKVEVIYDAETGAILSQHTRHASQKDGGTGVILTTQDRDFLGNGVDDSSDGDQGAGNDDGAGHDAGDDNGNDHENENDDGAGDDDHGGNEGNGKSGSGNSDND